MFNAKLIIVGGETKTTEVKLKFPCIIGRGKGATLLLRHPLVSRQHCELFEANGQLMVRDLGSLNGTYVNNEKIEEAIVPAGHLLTVGSVTFRAVYEPPAEDGTGERKTEVVYPNQATVAAMPPVAVAPPAEEAEEFDFDMSEEQDEPEPEPASPASVAEAEEPESEEPVDFDLEFDDESEGISSEPLFQPDPPAKPVAKPANTPTVANIKPVVPAAAAAKPAAVPAAKPAAPVAKPVAKPATPAPPPADDDEADEDLDDFLKSLNK
jgi:pSer/pThr/pTyr-binding forkhead associated (FHA) protein